MEKHITVLGALYIAFGILEVLIAIIFITLVIGGGIISGDEEAMAITSGVGAAVAAILIMIATPAIIGGIALLKYRPWARILVLILGCLNLLSIPFGTALGIYTIWVMIQDETVRLFGVQKRSAGQA